jgi:heptosyltransferase-1
MVKKILIVRVSSLGDVVHNMPAIADIHQRCPDAQIDWLVEESFCELVELVRGVRRAIPVSLRRWRRHLLRAETWREIRAFRRALAAEKYDLVIDCQGLIKTAWLASFAHGPLVGLGNRTEGAGYEWPARFFHDRSVRIASHTHVVERTRILVAAALDGMLSSQSLPVAAAMAQADPAALPDPAAPSLSSSSTMIDFGLDTLRASLALSQAGLNLPLPYVVFVHATSRADKQWPVGNWVATGQALVKRGVSLVLPWGSDAERTASQALAREFGAAAIVPPKLSLPAIVGLLDGAAATVGVDTGLVHIAAALKRPAVELYNFATAWRTGGYWSPNIVNLGTAGAPPTVGEVQRALTRFGV